VAAAKATLPIPMLRLLARWRHGSYYPPVGRVRLTDLRRTTPISRNFGFDRGVPIDRYYIEGFLARHATEIQGRVLEIGFNTYTRRFGGDRVKQSDVLHVDTSFPWVTLVADLTHADAIPSEIFDCIIFTQTLQCIYDVPAALATLQRGLKAGGVLLATFPGITQIPKTEPRWYWGFTRTSAERLFEEAFPDSIVEVKTYGNVLASTGFLYGLGVDELRQDELEFHDPEYQMVITVRVVKRGK
jgi:Methyltransferase domain